jgi:serine protease Do
MLLTRGMLRSTLRINPPRPSRRFTFHAFRTAAASLVALAAAAFPAATATAGTVPLDTRPDDFRMVVNRAKKNVFPAVVYLRCVVENFEQGRRLRATVSGSGVVISANGEILTNWHVIDRALEVRCLLNDGRAFSADVVGSDKDADLALVRLRLPAGEAIPFAKLGDSTRLQEGDFVMALGAPWGLNRSVSFGIVACARRYLPEGSEYSSWIQTDASISPGNSGGPLVDTEGLVIGINARGSMQGGDMGFAIPSETVSLVLPRLRAGGAAGWAWTGLQLQPLRDFQRNIYFEGDTGVIVGGTDENSPARTAGLLPQDRLLAIAGLPVTARMEEDLPEVRRRLALLPVSEAVSLTVRRDGHDLQLPLTPLAKGSVLGAELACPRWDFTVKAINQFEVPDLHYQRPDGIYVYGVRSPGNASGSGLSPRDILIRINGIDVHNIDEVRAIHAKSIAGLTDNGPRRLVLSVLRNGRTVQVVVDFSRDYSGG